jgi:hypothetical protein
MTELAGEFVIEDKTYAVTPSSMTVECGIITGEVSELKVVERIEKGSNPGRYGWRIHPRIGRFIWSRAGFCSSMPTGSPSSSRRHGRARP